MREFFRKLRIKSLTKAKRIAFERFQLAMSHLKYDEARDHLRRVGFYDRRIKSIEQD